MIYGHLKNTDSESQFYAPALQKGLVYLKNTDLQSLSTGKHLIDGENLFAVVSDYTTEKKDRRRAEAHKKYIDIQYIHSGKEVLGCSFLTAENRVLENRLEADDVIFYDAKQETDILLTPGCYAIVFPDDIHRPGCTAGNAASVRKVVVKIKI